MMYQKPFLKWVGGKTQLLETTLSKFPKEMNNYYEPFLGGGSVLLAVISLQKAGRIVIKGKICAYDINKDLINVYSQIQNNKDLLYEEIAMYISEHNSLTNEGEVNRHPSSKEEALISKESYYYWIRKMYNDMESNTISKAALFMILNKLCFRGLFREGPNGFNVPYGHYKTTPTIVTKHELNRISECIKDVEFRVKSFEDSVINIEKGDFVYFDPPYVPEKTTSFVEYNVKGFDMTCHKKLFDVLKELNKKNVKFVMSNAKVSFVIENCREFHSEDIVARRAINAKRPDAKTTEVLIYN